LFHQTLERKTWWMSKQEVIFRKGATNSGTKSCVICALVTLENASNVPRETSNRTSVCYCAQDSTRMFPVKVCWRWWLSSGVLMTVSRWW
jgi:hypothetical protein